MAYRRRKIIPARRRIIGCAAFSRRVFPVFNTRLVCTPRLTKGISYECNTQKVAGATARHRGSDNGISDLYPAVIYRGAELSFRSVFCPQQRIQPRGLWVYFYRPWLLSRAEVRFYSGGGAGADCDTAGRDPRVLNGAYWFARASVYWTADSGADFCFSDGTGFWLCGCGRTGRVFLAMGRATAGVCAVEYLLHVQHCGDCRADPRPARLSLYLLRAA